MKYTLHVLGLVLIRWPELSPYAYGQEEKKQIPNGTDGLVLDIRDSAASRDIEKLPPNEFVGSSSTFKIGLGLIYDFTAYDQSAEFKQQMDYAEISLAPTVKLRDFRILGQLPRKKS